MPRISAPSKDAIVAKPRAFVLMQMLNPAPDGSVPSEAFHTLLKQHGEAKAAGEDMSFEEFSALFHKPSSIAESGEGDCIGYAAFGGDQPLKPWRFARRAILPTDVRIQIAYVGICHSDIHQARNDWKNTVYPIIPGHEIAGIVSEVGSAVTKFKVGDRVGVGCLINSCQKCDQCKGGYEPYCDGPGGAVYTYNSKDVDGTITMGGYSTQVLAHQNYVLHIPTKVRFEDAAPLLCAGVTVYSPIRRLGFDKPGMHIGVIGLGGLGHMAVKFLKAMGVTTTVISTSPNKKDEATKLLGADHFLVSRDEEAMKACASTLDGIIDAVSAPHELEPYMALLKTGGTLCMLGIPETPSTVPALNLVFRRHVLTGSQIGGIAETQEMLDFCAEHDVACMTEHIPIEQVNTAYERVLKSDVRYRFVIDIVDSLFD